MFTSKKQKLLLAAFLTSSMAWSLGQNVESPSTPETPPVQEPNESAPPPKPSYTYRKPASNAAVFYVKNNFSLKKESDLKNAVKSLKGSTYSYNKKTKVYTWDLKGGILDGKNQRGDGGQSENQEPLIRVQMPLIIKNGFIRNNKDALSFFVPDSGAERLTWLNVGEDAVATHNGAYDFTIRDCEAINSKKGDKSFQFNESLGLLAEDNLIVGGITGMRIGDSKTTQVSEMSYVRNNRFFNVDTAHNISKITVKDLGGNTYTNVKKQWVLSNGAKLVK